MFTRVAIVNRGEAAMRLIHAVRDLNAQGGGAPIRSIALCARWRFVKSSGSITVAASPTATQLRAQGLGRVPCRNDMGAVSMLPPAPASARSASSSVWNAAA